VWLWVVQNKLQVKPYFGSKTSHKTKVNIRSMKDWISPILSCLALIVSAITAYFSILQQTDDVRIVTSSQPIVVFDDKGTLGLAGRRQITFINSGNRDAAVTDITLAIMRLRTSPVANSQCSELRNFQVANLVYDFEPFVVTPGEITIKTFDQTSFPQWKTDKVDSSRKFLSGPSNVAKGDAVVTCLRISMTTPDMVVNDVYAPKHYVIIKDFPSADPSPNSLLSDPNKPYPIVVQIHSRLGAAYELMWLHGDQQK
jgi:hypothetical protein